MILTNTQIQTLQSDIPTLFEGKQFKVNKFLWESAERWVKPYFKENGLCYKGWGLSEDGLRYRFIGLAEAGSAERFHFEVDKDGNVSNWQFNYLPEWKEPIKVETPTEPFVPTFDENNNIVYGAN